MEKFGCHAALNELIAQDKYEIDQFVTDQHPGIEKLIQTDEILKEEIRSHRTDKWHCLKNLQSRFRAVSSEEILKTGKITETEALFIRSIQADLGKVSKPLLGIH